MSSASPASPGDFTWQTDVVYYGKWIVLAILALWVMAIASEYLTRRK